jgi:hypothetical protein
MRVLSTLAAAVALGLAGASAFADVPVVPTPQPVSGPIPDASTGNSGIIVSVWDSVRNVSLVQFLGLRLDQFLLGDTNATPEAGLTLDFGTLGTASGSSSWSSVFGASDPANLHYMVTGFDNTANAGNTLVGKRLLTTFEAGPASVRNTALSGALTNAASFMASGLGGVDCAGGNPCVALSGSAGDYADGANFGANFGGSLAVASAATGVGTPLGFYLITATTNSGGTATAQLQQYQNSANLAQWLLTSAGNLKYTLDAAATVVPLPAAVWLLLSGLAGVGVIGRRRVA